MDTKQIINWFEYQHTINKDIHFRLEAIEKENSELKNFILGIQR